MSFKVGDRVCVRGYEGIVKDTYPDGWLAIELDNGKGWRGWSDEVGLVDEDVEYDGNWDGFVGVRDILDTVANENIEKRDEVSAILAERQQQYGHPSINFERIARAWNGIFMTKLAGGEQFTPTDVACAMIAVKLTRLQQGYKRDSATDIEGYARCIVTVNEDETL